MSSGFYFAVYFVGIVSKSSDVLFLFNRVEGVWVVLERLGRRIDFVIDPAVDFNGGNLSSGSLYANLSHLEAGIKCGVARYVFFFFYGITVFPGRLVDIGGNE